MTIRLKMSCKNCGLENVLRDAWAEWDSETQQWVLSNVFDHAYCDNCESDTTILEEAI
jgi:Zn finger protein HypA/HybF involved in hydrogenase expression